MTNQELWVAKTEVFEEQLYKHLGQKDTHRLLLCLHETKLTALEGVLLSGQAVSQEELYGIYCRALDETAAKWFGFPVLSSMQDFS